MTGSRVLWLPLAGALILSCCASSSQRLRTRTTDEPGDAVAVEVVHHFSLEHDGTFRHRVLERTRLVTEHAIDELGDPRIAHRAGRETLQVVRAETSMRDGTIVAIQPNSITETVPDALGLAPAYTDLRETVVTLVGLETGCTTLLEHERAARGHKGPVWAEVPLATWYPTEKLSVQVAVPEDYPLRWSCLGCRVQPVEEKTAQGSSLRFDFTQVAPLNLDEVGREHLPVPGQPRLVFSTAASWRVLIDALRADLDRASTVDTTVQQRARDLTEHALRPQERALALQRFVASDLATVHWPQDALGWTPRSAAQVLDSSYGHALDKAVLLAALLLAVDIPATPVLISRDGLVDPKVPALAPFDELWLVVELDGQPLWLSPLQVHGTHGLAWIEGRWALPLLAGRPDKLPVLIARSPLALGQPLHLALGDEAVQQHQTQLSAAITLGDDGTMQLDVDQRLTGAYGASHEVNPDKGGQALAATLVQDLGLPKGVTATEGQPPRLVELSPAQTRVTATLAGQAAGVAAILELPLPRPARSQLAGLDLHRLHRDLPFELAHRGIERSVIEIQLPDGVELRSKLLEGELRNSVGSVITRHEHHKGRLVLTRELVLTQRLIAADKWPELRALAHELLRADAQTLLFVKKLDDDAP
ncbi:MAG: DUF3857 domain-containing protein [Pseudomonadota bacterium]